MKTAKCPTCGGIVFKLAGKLAAACHDECLDCRRNRAAREELDAETAIAKAADLGDHAKIDRLPFKGSTPA